MRRSASASGSSGAGGGASGRGAHSADSAGHSTSGGRDVSPVAGATRRFDMARQTLVRHFSTHESGEWPQFALRHCRADRVIVW